MAAFRSFVARRGCPAKVFTDNGSNFLGAHAELKEIITLLRSEHSECTVTTWAARRDIEWHFSPARAPHFGGLWEAAVRQMKILLKKTVGSTALTYEELSTLLTEAEAILNSRPLVPLDSLDDDGIAPLTPGHFLTGGPLSALPALPDQTTKLSLLKGWNRVQRITNDLWKRWKAEYLTQLQRRSKWERPEREMKVNDIVILKDASSFQRIWPMARVTKVYPGDDGHVRVVDMLTNGKTFRRPITRLVPILEDEMELTSSRGENVRVSEASVTDNKLQVQQPEGVTLND